MIAQALSAQRDRCATTRLATSVVKSVRKLKCSPCEPAGERRASACRRARDLRDHGRPRAGDDVPLALPARGARAPRLPDRRRRLRRLVARAARRACARLDRRDGRADRRGRLRAAREAALLRPRRLHRCRDLCAGRQGDRTADEPGLLPRDPAFALRHGRRRARERGSHRERARRRREAVRARPRFRTRAERGAARADRRVAALPDRPLPREDVRRGHPLPPLREHDPRAGLEPAVRLVACRSRWARTSTSPTAATSTTPSARCATSCRTTSCRS